MCPARVSRRHACLAVALVCGSAARAKPPGINFRLQWRLVPWPPPPIGAPAPGSVTTGTGTGTAPSPPGSVTTRTAPAGTEAPPALLLRNGGQARIAWLRDDPDASPDWVWSAEAGQGLRGRTRRLSRREALWVQVHWPGGGAPAQLGFRFEQPLDDARPAAAGTQQLDGEVLVALDAWQQVGHWAGADGRGQALQLRLSRLP
jgi:hypothetical protein